jgi:hypothetical protein
VQVEKSHLAFGPAGVAFLAVVALIGIMTTLQAKMDEFNANESKSAASNLAKDLKSVKQSDVNHILNMLDNASKYANKTGSETESNKSRIENSGRALF